MIDYGLLAAKSSEIFSNLLSELRSLWDSIPFPVWIAISILVIVGYFLIRNWLGLDN
jgi:hypothetical protein